MTKTQLLALQLSEALEDTQDIRDELELESWNYEEEEDE